MQLTMVVVTVHVKIHQLESIAAALLDLHFSLMGNPAKILMSVKATMEDVIISVEILSVALIAAAKTDLNY